MVLLINGCGNNEKILALNFFPAFVPISNGGESKLYNFYKALSKYHHVTLLTSTHPGVKEEKYIIRRHSLSDESRRINILINAGKI